MLDKDLAKLFDISPNTMTNWKTDRAKLLSVVELGLKTEEHIEKSKNYLESFKKELQYKDLQTYIKKKEKELTNTDLARIVEVAPKTIKNWRETKPYLIKLIYFGIATEKHIKNMEEYLEEIKKEF